MGETFERLARESQEHEARGDMPAAFVSMQLAREEAARQDDLTAEIGALARMARLKLYAGSIQHAADFARQALEAAGADGEKPDHAPIRVDALTTLGQCAGETSDIPAAERYFHQALEQARQANDLPGMARALHNLAVVVYFFRGQFDLALAAMQEASRIKGELGQPAYDLVFLQGFIYQVLGDRFNTRRMLNGMSAFIGSSPRLAVVYYLVKGRLALDEDDPAGAREALEQAYQLATRLGAVEINVWVRLAYSHYHRLEGSPALAFQWAEDALGFAQRGGSRYYEAQARVERGYALWLAGDSGEAEADLRLAATELETLGNRHDLARAVFLLAAFYHQAQREAEGEQAWLQTARLINRGGYAFILERERPLAIPLISTFLRNPKREAREAAEAMLKHLEHTAPLPLRVLGLGQFAVWQGRRALDTSAWQRRKAGELFRFLLLQPRYSAPRDVVIEALWPSKTDAATSLFHQATSTLRHLLEPDLPEKFPSHYLFVENERVSLKLPPGSSVDFLEFQEQLPRAMRERSLTALLPVLAVYGGDLFPQDVYQAWSAPARDSLLELYHSGMVAAAQLHLAQAQFPQALELAQRVLSRSPWKDDAALVGMQALLGMNDGPRAIRMYHALEKTLRKELDMAPSEELEALAKKARRRI